MTKGHTRGVPAALTQMEGGVGGRPRPRSSGRRWRQLVLSHRPSSRPGWAVSVTKADGALPPPLPQHRRPVLELRAPCLPLTVREQGREPHTSFCVGSRWGEPNPSCRNVGAGPRTGCVTPALPTQALGSPQLHPQALILSVLMRDPHLRQNTPSSAQKHVRGPSLPHAQGSGAEASRGRLGPAGTQSRCECIYIFI